MACPICGANCQCKKRGPNGLCCGCHKHKNQRGFTRRQLDDWRAEHQLEPVSDAQWKRSYAKDAAQLMEQMEQADASRG
jgi:hypothetical protein